MARNKPPKITESPADLDAPLAAAPNDRSVDGETNPAIGETNTQADETTRPGAEPMLHVTAKVDGFRRGGRAWPKTETIVPASEFTPEQLAAILAEPRLIASVE